MTSDRSRSLTLALCGGYFLVLLDVTVVNVALPRIDAVLDAGSTGLAWVVDAYAIPLAALLLPAGTIGDRIGHRRVVLLGFGAFGAASLVCALAPTIQVLIAARAVQGVGAATALPGTLALLVQGALNERARSRLVGVWAAIGGAALPAGPVIGGLLVQVAGWRAVFWLSVPVIMPALGRVAKVPLPVSAARWTPGCVVVGRHSYRYASLLRLASRPSDPPIQGSGLSQHSLVPVVRLSADRRASDSERSVNWSAAALLVIGLTCAVSAIMTVAASAPAATMLALAAGGALTALRAVERRSPHPLLPIPPGARRPLAAACLVAGVMNLCALGSLFLLTLVLQDVQGRDPLAAGLLILPAMLPLPLLGAPAGRLATRIGVWRTSLLGLIVAAVGLVGMAMTIDGADPFTLAIALLVWGVGLGVLTPAIVAAALRAVPDLPGLAAGASNTSRQAGGALGIALFAALAGPSEAASFPSNAANLFVGSAVAFVVAAVACLAMVRVHS